MLATLLAVPDNPTIMAENLFVFPCPCCSKLVELDVRSGKARAVRPEEKAGGQDLDQLLRAQKRDGKRLDDLFQSAKGDEARKHEQLDAKLRRAKDEAKRDGTDKPRNPFDLE